MLPASSQIWLSVLLHAFSVSAFCEQGHISCMLFSIALWQGPTSSCLMTTSLLPFSAFVKTRNNLICNHHGCGFMEMRWLSLHTLQCGTIKLAASQAEKFRSKAQRPEPSRSHTQFCRYLYYLGRIKAIQLEYTDARDYLQQAARKVSTQTVLNCPSVARGLYGLVAVLAASVLAN